MTGYFYFNINIKVWHKFQKPDKCGYTIVYSWVFFVFSSTTLNIKAQTHPPVKLRTHFTLKTHLHNSKSAVWNPFTESLWTSFLLLPQSLQNDAHWCAFQSYIFHFIRDFVFDAAHAKRCMYQNYCNRYTNVVTT